MKHALPTAGLVALTLHDSQTSSWTLTMSADCAQFVGRYPRLPGFGSRGRLLDFLPIVQAGQPG